MKKFLVVLLVSFFCFIPVNAKEVKYEIVSGDIETVGSEVCFDTECFYVIGNDGSNVSLLAKYNLYVGSEYNNGTLTAYGNDATGMQDENMLGNLFKTGVPSKGVTAFSDDSKKGENYSDYVEKNISPIELRQGSRSYEEVYSGFSQTEKRMAKNLYKNVCAKDDHQFPLTGDSIRDKSFIARRKIDSERFAKIKSVGKKHGATINDVLLTAYFYSLYELAGYGDNESVTISCAIDLRRHMKDVSDKGITNHTAFMQCSVPRRGRDIFETLQYVVHSSNKNKHDKFMGLYGLPLLKFGYSILPHTASEEIIKIGYSNPLLAMSNIGILEVDKLALAGHEPTDGFMTGAVKYKPYVLLSATSMRNEVTLSMCVRGNDGDKKIVDRFFDLMEKNLGTMIENE